MEGKEQPQCPKCKEKSAVVSIVYGRPGPQLLEDSKNGKVHLGGCSMDSKHHYCKTCKLEF